MRILSLLKNLKIRTIGTMIAGFLLFVAAVMAMTLQLTVREVVGVGQTWEAFDTGAAVKSRILGELRGALGYGGMIHEFKNFVLRRDRQQIVRVQEKLFDVTGALLDYQALGMNAREETALARVYFTVHEYASVLAIAERMAVTGATSQEIDDAVFFDDSPTLEALWVLETEITALDEASAQRVYDSVIVVERFAFAAAIVVGVLLMILIVSFLWFTRVRLVRPLAALGNTMESLAGGDNAVAIPALDRADEIGGMARTVQVFKETAIQRERAEAELLQSETRFSEILDIAAEAVISIDEKGTIQLFNQGAENIFGYKGTEIVGYSIDVLLPERFRKVHRDNILRFHNESGVTGRMSLNREIYGLRKDGTEFAAEGSISKLTQGNDEIFTIMLHDITERKQAEGMLRNAKEQAELANRTKSEFLANMSHELRTPLNAIIGFSEMILGRTFGPIGSPKYTEYVSDINESGIHLLNLINDILDLSKIEAGKDQLQEEFIEVPKVVESVRRLIGQRAADGGVTLSWEIPDNLPMLYADERKLKQILINLIGNAIKFSQPGDEAMLSVWCQPDSGFVFQVVDNGIGIAAIDIPKALSHFGQVDGDLNRKFEGTGLGLPLAKAFIELHGGHLDMQSVAGLGTTVTVRLPATRPAKSQHG